MGDLNSSLNTFQMAGFNRKTYLERDQPENRRNFGHLEKHSDYLKRTKVLKKKSDAVKSAMSAALLKNKDEFYHAMINHKNQKSMTMKEKLSLNKDGNKNYLRFKITTIKKEISKLEKSHTVKEKNDENDQQSYVEDKHLQQLKKSLKELTHADD